MTARTAESLCLACMEPSQQSYCPRCTKEADDWAELFHDHVNLGVPIEPRVCAWCGGSQRIADDLMCPACTPEPEWGQP